MNSQLTEQNPSPQNENTRAGRSSSNPNPRVKNAAGDILQAEDDSGNDDSAKYVVELELLPEPATYVVQDFSGGNPCCMPLQIAIYMIVFMEIFAYLLGLGFYLYFYFKLSGTHKLADTLDLWSTYHYYRIQLANGVRFESIKEFLTALAIAEICCCSMYIILTLLLLIGAIKRNFALGITWVCGIFALTICRLSLLLLAPIHAFQLGFIWFIFELYFMYVVVCFAIDCRVNPEGTEVYSIPYSEPIYAGPYGYPVIGYQLVGYKSTNMAQARPTGRNPNQNVVNNNILEPGNGDNVRETRNANASPERRNDGRQRQARFNPDAPYARRYSRV